MAKYGLIGHGLEHSQSQHLHSLIGDYEYDLIEVAEEKELEKVVGGTGEWESNFDVGSSHVMYRLSETQLRLDIGVALCFGIDR